MENIKIIATGSKYEVPEMTEDKNFVKINLSAEVNKLRREKAAKTIYLIKKAWYDYLDNAFGYSVVGFVNTIDEADKICNGGGVVNYGMDHPEYISQEIKYYDGSEKNYQIEPFPKETRNPNMVIGKQFYSIEDIKKQTL